LPWLCIAFCIILSIIGWEWGRTKTTMDDSDYESIGRFPRQSKLSEYLGYTLVFLFFIILIGSDENRGGLGFVYFIMGCWASFLIGLLIGELKVENNRKLSYFRLVRRIATGFAIIFALTAVSAAFVLALTIIGLISGESLDAPVNHDNFIFIAIFLPVSLVGFYLVRRLQEYVKWRIRDIKRNTI